MSKYTAKQIAESDDLFDKQIHKVRKFYLSRNPDKMMMLEERKAVIKERNKGLSPEYDKEYYCGTCGANVINEGVVPAVEGCVGYTNEEFERVNKENNDPESAKMGSFNKTVEEANNIRSRVLKYVDKIKQERAYNIDLCMTFERYIEIADKDAERAMAFLKEAYPFNEETEIFIRKRYNMSIDVNPEEN